MVTTVGILIYLVSFILWCSVGLLGIFSIPFIFKKEYESRRGGPEDVNEEWTSKEWTSKEWREVLGFSILGPVIAGFIIYGLIVRSICKKT
jgi:hypothetical protein